MNHHMHLEAKDNDRCYMFTLYCIRYKTFPAQMQNGGDWGHVLLLGGLHVCWLAGWLAGQMCVYLQSAILRSSTIINSLLDMFVQKRPSYVYPIFHGMYSTCMYSCDHFFLPFYNLVVCLQRGGERKTEKTAFSITQPNKFVVCLCKAQKDISNYHHHCSVSIPLSSSVSALFFSNGKILLSA